LESTPPFRMEPIVAASATSATTASGTASNTKLDSQLAVLRKEMVSSVKCSLVSASYRAIRCDQIPCGQLGGAKLGVGAYLLQICFKCN
jgi:hypothetical protein